MSSDERWILSKVPPGSGIALDLGGGSGGMRLAVERLGYEYVNIDIDPKGPRSIVGDAHALPLRQGAVDLVLSKDSLEHIANPMEALAEVRRVITPHGRFVIWVPFLHPFHSSDYYRYTPLGLHHLFEGAGFRIETIEAPLWVFSVFGQAAVGLAQRLGAGRLEVPIERAGERLDQMAARFRGKDMSFAYFFLVVASPCE